MLQSEALAAFAQQKGLQNPFRVRKVLLVCHDQGFMSGNLLLSLARCPSKRFLSLHDCAHLGCQSW